MAPAWKQRNFNAQLMLVWTAAVCHALRLRAYIK